MTFFALGETALLQRYSRDENTNKVSYIYASLYGFKKDARELLSGFIKRNADKNTKLLLCLCPENISPGSRNGISIWDYLDR